MPWRVRFCLRSWGHFGAHLGAHLGSQFWARVCVWPCVRPRMWIGSALLLSGLLAGLGAWLWLAYAPCPPLLEDLPYSRVVLDRNKGLMRLGLSEDEKYRVRIRFGDIPSAAVQAVLLYEDRYFYAHPGFNPLALGRALYQTYGGGRRMGGSTITMQVVRLRAKLPTTTWAGKIRQIVQALQWEYRYTKTEILEAYFTLAPYGSNIEGLGAAAWVYFRKAPQHLTLTECLALTVIPQNPVSRDPLRGRDFHAARARMQALWQEHQGDGGLFAAVPPVSPLPPLADRTKGQGLQPLRIYSPASLPFKAPHVVMEVLAQSAGLTQPGQDSSRPLHTTIDPAQQLLVENMLARFAGRGRAYGLDNAAALLLHWPSMDIRALAGSANFFDPRIQGQVDGTKARRSPGSTLKPFIYGLALDQGLIHPMSVLLDTPRSFRGYDPENFDRTFRGPLPARDALLTSRNIPAIGLAARLKNPDFYQFLQDAGVALNRDAAHYGLSLVLGGAEVSMRELAQLYAMLARQGRAQQARLLLRLLNSGAEVEQSRRLLSPEAAFIVLNMLEDPHEFLPGPQGRIPIRMKTGTSNGFRDAWAAGIVGPYVLIVWVGNFDNSSNPLLIGGEVAAPLYADISRALVNTEKLVDTLGNRQENWGDALNVQSIEVCKATGDTDLSLCPETVPTLFIPGLSPVRSSKVFRKILVDTHTGLRACQPQPGRTEEQVWEFWPSDTQSIFLRAGIVKKPPPPFGPECGPQDSVSLPAGNPPRIRIPKQGMVYQVRLSDPARNSIPLTASTDADAESVFWFADERYLGQSPPDQQFLWRAPAGMTRLKAVDNLGRASSQSVRVQALP